VVPWRKPWSNANAVNWNTQRPYRGINTFLVEPGEYASKKQILEAGGRIKKEEMKHSHIIVYWLWKEKRRKRNMPTPSITGFGRLISKNSYEIFYHDPIEKGEEIFKGYVHSPDYTFQSGQAVYYPTWN
jgi:hypothetical protein